MDEDLLASTRAVLVARWQVPEVQSTAGASTWEVLLEELQERVLHLLRYNPRKLMTALYILDISERRYLQAMDQPTMEDRAHDLARAILERETEKIETRKRYAQPPRAGIDFEHTQERDS